MRIVRIANFLTPVSGGVRTALAHLAREYRARGIDPVLVIPGPADARHDGPDGTIITLASPRLPGTSYHMLVDRSRLKHAVRRLEPDAVEVHDRFTLDEVGEAFAYGVTSGAHRVGVRCECGRRPADDGERMGRAALRGPIPPQAQARLS